MDTLIHMTFPRTSMAKAWLLPVTTPSRVHACIRSHANTSVLRRHQNTRHNLASRHARRYAYVFTGAGMSSLHEYVLRRHVWFETVLRAGVTNACTDRVVSDQGRYRVREGGDIISGPRRVVAPNHLLPPPRVIHRPRNIPKLHLQHEQTRWTCTAEGRLGMR